MTALLSLLLLVLLVAVAVGAFIGFAILYVKAYEKIDDWRHPL